MLDYVSSLDYNDFKVIVGGEETTAHGGGLCHVTSTLYNAANFAGLDVIERSPHSSQLPYIRPGVDATVWWGGPGKRDALDINFPNTTDSYLLLREYVSEDEYTSTPNSGAGRTAQRYPCARGPHLSGRMASAGSPT